MDPGFPLIRKLTKFFFKSLIPRLECSSYLQHLQNYFLHEDTQGLISVAAHVNS